MAEKRFSWPSISVGISFRLPDLDVGIKPILYEEYVHVCMYQQVLFLNTE